MAFDESKVSNHKRRCENCLYYAEPKGTCVCANSEQFTDLTDKNFVCGCHEDKETLQKDRNCLGRNRR